MEASEFRRADINYESLFGNLYVLMNNAGKSVSEFITGTLGTNKKICVVCGKGNNGGDGLVAARELSKNNDVTVVPVEGKSRMSTLLARRAMRSYKGKIVGLEMLNDELKRSDVVVDALLGTGISGNPKYPYDLAIKEINASKKTVVSVDVPSGMGSEIAVVPQYTVTFSQKKDGMDERNSGKIVVADIGIPEQVFRFAGPGDMIYYPLPRADSHKGMNGTLAIIGGLDYYGSAVIAAEGATGIGIDLVRVFTSTQNYPIIGSYDPGYIVRIMSDNQEDFVDELMKNSAILVGSGNGMGDLAGKALQIALSLEPKPVVLDADAIKMMGSRSYSGRQNMVVTPNKNEFRILTNKDPTEENAERLASEKNMVVVLKGQTDIVTNGDRTILVDGGNPRMTMGGTGDMLAGIIGGLCSKGIAPFRASVMGCYILKRSSELAYSQYGLWYNINHLSSIIPVTMNNLVPTKKD
ncbi:MAG: hypothetical protein B2I17_00615 [Thermoplasmatales archaeon B_DKE]|nr:MAG: hypothetical protein B2I17_00615 [Thermoplasmatales archaeon B_DKE]